MHAFTTFSYLGNTPYLQPMDQVISQKLDTLLTNFEEQKKILVKSEKDMKKKVLDVKAELNELKKCVEENPTFYYRSKQRVPRDVSVSFESILLCSLNMNHGYLLHLYSLTKKYKSVVSYI